MAKRKNFRDFYDQYEEDDWSDTEPRYAKKDTKRYDRKKAKIQKARRNKNKNKFSHLE